VSLPSQQYDHVVINKGGKVIGRDGMPLKAPIDKDRNRGKTAGD
jgi:hypothetical protein